MQVDAVPDADVLRDHWWWRPGWAPGSRRLAWHLTFDSHAPLVALVSAYQHALEPFPTIDPVPHEWLHLTLTDIGPAAAVTDQQRAALVEGARIRTGGDPAPELLFSHVVLFAESVVLMPQPPDAVVALQHDLVTSADAVLGRQPATSGSHFVPHLSIGYVNGTQDGSAVLAALRSVDAPPPVPLRPALSLIEVHRDHRQYEWRTIHAFGPA